MSTVLLGWPSVAVSGPTVAWTSSNLDLSPENCAKKAYEIFHTDLITKSYTKRTWGADGEDFNGTYLIVCFARGTGSHAVVIASGKSPNVYGMRDILTEKIRDPGITVTFPENN
jgi:hypothetical protein